MSFHIGRRICFGKAEILRFLQHVCIISALFHLAEHVIGRSIHNSRYALYGISRITRLQGMNNGNASTNSSFHRHWRRLRSRYNFIHVRRQQRLVGRHDSLFLCQGFHDNRLGERRSAHNFDDAVNLRILENGIGICHELTRAGINLKIARLVERANANLLNDNVGG